MKEIRDHLWKSNAQAEFNRWAKTYDRSILNRLLFNRCYLKFIEYIVRYFPEPQGRLKLLDVGCGTGTFVSMLKSVGLPVYPLGLDMAETMCQLAQKKAEQVNGEKTAGFVVGDSEHMPFADGSFDLVTCSNSFHHYPHQQTVLGEFFRILKPGGRVVVLDGYRDNVIGWAIFDVGVGTVEKSVHHCPAGEIREQMRQAGFGDVEQEKFGFWVPVLATMGKKK